MPHSLAQKIAFSINKLCQLMHAPTDNHWLALKRLLRYLKHTLHYYLFFDRHVSHHLQCFTNSDWGGCHDDRRSINGYATYLGNNLISWCAKKEPTITQSSSESEYKALANTTTELLWIQHLLSKFNFSSSSSETLWCDNIRAIHMSSNLIFHACTKHIELNYHFSMNKLPKVQSKSDFYPVKTSSLTYLPNY